MDVFRTIFNFLFHGDRMILSTHTMTMLIVKLQGSCTETNVELAYNVHIKIYFFPLSLHCHRRQFTGNQLASAIFHKETHSHSCFNSQRTLFLVLHFPNKNKQSTIYYQSLLSRPSSETTLLHFNLVSQNF